MAILVIGVLAAVANAATLTVHDSPRQTANAFTSLNAGVFLALLLGVLGTTGADRVPANIGQPYRRAIGTKARAFGLVGAAVVLILAGLAAAVVLPIIHARGIATPSNAGLAAYVEREAVASVRLALLGVAIGIVVIRRWPAVVGLITFLIIEAMNVKRVVPDFQTEDPGRSTEFYAEVLGLVPVMDLGWIVTFAAPENPSAQISVMRADATASVAPDASIEVDDVDAAFAAAQRLGCEIVHPLTDEPWGVRRFFVRDPSGQILNVLAHP